MNLKRLVLGVLTAGIVTVGTLAPAADGSGYAYAEETKTETTETTEAVTEGDKEVEEVKEYPPHTHTFKWVAKMNESESAEGTLNYMCTQCGKIWYYRPIAPFHAFVGDVANRIENAPENSTVQVKTSLFFAFNKQVMQALADRPDVSLYVTFLDQQYKGNRVSFTIPAGEDTMALLDENGYCGFLYLAGIYGLKMEVPMEVTDTPDAQETEEDTANQ